MQLRDIVQVIETALECSVYHSPKAMGLTFDELVEIGSRMGIRKGELPDAIANQGLNRNRQNRYEHCSTLQNKLMFPGMLNPDYRPLKEMDFIHIQLKEIARDDGAANARITRDVLIARAEKAGHSRHDMEVAIAVSTIANRLTETNDIVQFVRGMEQSPPPSELERQQGGHNRHINTIREPVNRLVADIVARRQDGRPKSIDTLNEFANRLEYLGYKPFRLWWMQILSEMKTADNNTSSVTVSVLAAALMEGALTFIVRHAISLKNGTFASKDWEREPNTWKIDDLLKAASGGGPDAILDQSSKVRAETLIRVRQRIHAGRMLVDHPNGVQDLRPEEARDARLTLEIVVRKILDWIETHPRS